MKFGTRGAFDADQSVVCTGNALSTQERFVRHNALFGGIARLKNRIHPVENSVVQSRLPRRKILQRSRQVSVAWKEGIQDSSSTANQEPLLRKHSWGRYINAKPRRQSRRREFRKVFAPYAALASRRSFSVSPDGFSSCLRAALRAVDSLETAGACTIGQRTNLEGYFRAKLSKTRKLPPPPRFRQ